MYILIYEPRGTLLNIFDSFFLFYTYILTKTKYKKHNRYKIPKNSWLFNRFLFIILHTIASSCAEWPRTVKWNTVLMANLSLHVWWMSIMFFLSSFSYHLIGWRREKKIFLVKSPNRIVTWKITYGSQNAFFSSEKHTDNIFLHKWLLRCRNTFRIIVYSKRKRKYPIGEKKKQF